MKEATTTQKIWKAIRGLQKFTHDDLATITGCSYQIAKTYVSLLVASGYVRALGREPAPAGGRTRKIVYLLVKNTGPRAPARHDCLYDPNTGELHGRHCNEGRLCNVD